jgi:hypothetical protein
MRTRTFHTTLIRQYLDNELAPAEHRAVEERLASDAEFRQEVDLQRELTSLLAHEAIQAEVNQYMELSPIDWDAVPEMSDEELAELEAAADPSEVELDSEVTPLPVVPPISVVETPKTPEVTPVKPEPVAQPPKTVPLRRAAPWWSLAAAVALLLGVGWGVYRFVLNPPSQPQFAYLDVNASRGDAPPTPLPARLPVVLDTLGQDLHYRWGGTATDTVFLFGPSLRLAPSPNFSLDDTQAGLLLNLEGQNGQPARAFRLVPTRQVGPLPEVNL